MSRLRLESVSCGACGSREARPFASGRDFEYASSEDTYYVQRCLKCDNLYLDPRPARESLGVIYPPMNRSLVNGRHEGLSCHSSSGTIPMDS